MAVKKKPVEECVMCGDKRLMMTCGSTGKSICFQCAADIMEITAIEMMKKIDPIVKIMKKKKVTKK